MLAVGGVSGALSSRPARISLASDGGFVNATYTNGTAYILGAKDSSTGASFADVTLWSKLPKKYFNRTIISPLSGLASVLNDESDLDSAMSRYARRLGVSSSYTGGLAGYDYVNVTVEAPTTKNYSQKGVAVALANYQVRVCVSACLLLCVSLARVCKWHDRERPGWVWGRLGRKRKMYRLPPVPPLPPRLSDVPDLACGLWLQTPFPNLLANPISKLLQVLGTVVNIASLFTTLYGASSRDALEAVWTGLALMLNIDGGAPGRGRYVCACLCMCACVGGCEL